MLAGLAFASAATAGDAARRLGAELLILAGDARRLAQDRIGPRERAGLNERLQGALAYLPLLLRRAGDDPQPAAALREALARHDLKKFAFIVQGLSARYGFAPGWMARAPDRDLVAAGAKLHGEVCAGCHAADWGDTALPARQLQGLASGQAREEFAARLWLGVRGTREVAYANPFSDEELAALFAYYRSPQ